jgi:GntR family transcriptional regulator
MGRVPVYQVIYSDLAAQIHEGTLAPGDVLPGDVALCQQYGVSRMTVRQALDQLVRERLVTRRRGARTVVADQKAAGRHLSLQSFHAELGLAPDAVMTKLLASEVVTPPVAIAQALQLGPGAQASELKRLRCVEGEPAALQTSWIPLIIAPQLTREPLVGNSLYRTLQERWGIELGWAEQTISASLASREQARLLDVKERSALISAERLTFTSDGIPTELSRSWTTNAHPLVVRLDRG